MDQKSLILDIAMNLSRIGNWAADDYIGKQKRITLFLNQTSAYLTRLDLQSFNEPLRHTLINFKEKFTTLRSKSSQKDSLKWAEMMMTWGNILTHRSKLLN